MTSLDDFNSAIFGFRTLIEEFKTKEHISSHKISVVIINQALINFFKSFGELRPYPDLLNSLYGIIDSLHTDFEYILKSEAPLPMYAIVEDMLEKYNIEPAYMVLKGEDYAMIPYTYWLNLALRGVAPELDRLCSKFADEKAQIYFLYSSSRALDHPIRWPALYHEVAHVIDYYKKFSDKRYPEETLAPDHRESFEFAKNYYRESFADILATHYLGSEYGRVLYDFLYQSPWDESSPHPPHHERIKLIAEELNFLAYQVDGKKLKQKAEELRRERFPQGCRFVIQPEVKENVQEDVRNIESPELPRKNEIKETLKDFKKDIPCPMTDPRTLFAATIKSGNPKKYFKILETSLNMYALEILRF